MHEIQEHLAQTQFENAREAFSPARTAESGGLCLIVKERVVDSPDKGAISAGVARCGKAACR